MLINVIKAEYLGEFKISLSFSNAESVVVDLRSTIYSDVREIFKPLQNVEYFKTFRINLNTITWDNEADFAPEFLLDLGKAQQNNTLTFA